MFLLIALRLPFSFDFDSVLLGMFLLIALQLLSSFDFDSRLFRCVSFNSTTATYLLSILIVVLLGMFL